MATTYRVAGKKIQEARKLKQLTQETVADALGMSPQAYSRIETNVTKKVDIEILEKLGTLFGVNYNDWIVKEERRVNQRIKVGDNNQGDCYNVYKSPRKTAKREQELEKENEYLKRELLLKDELLAEMQKRLDLLERK